MSLQIGASAYEAGCVSKVKWVPKQSLVRCNRLESVLQSIELGVFMNSTSNGCSRGSTETSQSLDKALKQIIAAEVALKQVGR
jgi:hypothetical protein